MHNGGSRAFPNREAMDAAIARIEAKFREERIVTRIDELQRDIATLRSQLTTLRMR